METTVRLYTLNYDEAKTYMWAAIFVACNLGNKSHRSTR